MRAELKEVHHVQHHRTDRSGLAEPRFRRRRAVGILLSGAAATGILAVGAPAAQAAGPAIIGPRTIAVFPTWGWGGNTRVCVTTISNAAFGYAKVRVTPTSNPNLYDDIYADPGQTSCITRSWWGAPIVANNLSNRATVSVRTY